MVLDTTSVSDAAIGAIKALRPSLDVMRSHRRALEEIERLGVVVQTQPHAAEERAARRLGMFSILTPCHYSRSVGIRLSQLDGRILGWIARMAELRALDLSQSNFGNTSLESLASLQRLESLWLGYNVAFADAAKERVSDETLAHVVVPLAAQPNAQSTPYTSRVSARGALRQ